MSIKRRSLAFVLNEAASQCPELPAALDELRDNGFQVNSFPLANTEQAVQSNCDVIVAAGGDGTVNKVVSALLNGANESTAVGVLAYGTGNDFATACGIPQDLSAALRLIAEGQPQPIDIGKVNERHFINAVSGGFGAEVTADTSEELKAMLGKLAYTVAGLGKLFQGEERQALIRAEDFEWKGSLLFLSIANGRLAGGGYHVAPQAMIDDGLLDVLIVPDAGLMEAPSVLIELFGLGTVDTDHVQYVRTPWLTVDTPKSLQLSIDGEPLEAKSFRVDVQPRRLRLLLPEQAPLSASGA